MCKSERSVIITGATSFIGVHLINECLKNNCKVIALVRPNSKKLNRLPKSQLLKIIQLDINKIEDLLRYVNRQEVSVFYHLAWEGTRVPYRNNINVQNQNYNSAVKAMIVAEKLKCKTFIGAGSQAEYGKCTGRISEIYSACPITEYGRAKLKTYETLSKMAKENKMKFIWTRIFSVYGMCDYEGTLIMSALHKMKKNESIPLTECTQNWDFIHVKDVAKAMYLLGEQPCEAGIYNIASGQGRQLKDFVIEMKKICNSKSELKFGELYYNGDEIVSFEPIVEKLKKNLNWQYKIKFKEGIEELLKSMD